MSPSRAHRGRRGVSESWQRHRLLDNFDLGLDIDLARGRDLRIVLIQVERGVKFRLANEQFLHARFVIERLVGLRLIIVEGFPQV
jgi:hypothetical protein